MGTWLRDAQVQPSPRVSNLKWRIIATNAGNPNQAVGGYIELAAAVNNGLHIISRTPPVVECGVTGRFRRTGVVADMRNRIVLGHTGAYGGGTGESIGNGYALRINATGQIDIQRFVGLASSIVSNAVTGKVPADTWIRFRFERMGGAVRARVWPEGTTEPTTWDVEGTDDGGPTAGGLGLSTYRTSTATVAHIGDIDFYAKGVPQPSRVQRWFRPDGAEVPYGRVIRARVDDCLDATPPAWITSSALTSDPDTATRTVTAPASGTATLAAPAVRAATVRALRLVVENFRTTVDSGLVPALRLAGAAWTYELRQSGAYAELAATPASGTTLIGETNYKMIKDGEGPRHRTLSLVLLPQLRQLVAYEGQSPIGWIDLVSLPTEALTPTLAVAATSTTAAGVGYSKLQVITEAL